MLHEKTIKNYDHETMQNQIKSNEFHSYTAHLHALE